MYNKITQTHTLKTKTK